jgi:hypothetical protein
MSDDFRVVHRRQHRTGEKHGHDSHQHDPRSRPQVRANATIASSGTMTAHDGSGERGVTTLTSPAARQPYTDAGIR